VLLFGQTVPTERGRPCEDRREGAVVDTAPGVSDIVELH